MHPIVIPALRLLSVTLVSLAVIGEAEVDANGAQVPSWDQLVSNLSDQADFKLSRPDDWIDQCVHPFDGTSSKGLSNYQLFPKPSGLCQAHLLCSYEECKGPFPLNLFTASATTYKPSEYIDETWKSDDRLNLPDAVVHPKHAGDVSEAIKFAVQHKIGVSVKTSGHSYTGSSTKKGTILLNLSKLQKYSPDGSIVECKVQDNNSGNTIPQGSYQDACNLAIARDKQAVVRVGGGEIFDELLRAVSKTWNEDEQNVRKYHVVSGGAGTVSAAGGWLASGGLSGNNGMRLYGLGVDQVLHVEMVLPSGIHVRFGPTDWVEDTEKIYPVTTKVTGYCNRGDLSDEASWDWQMCEGDNAGIDFHGLWYAVRGGGGGTYGVVTSIYYQLHDIPNPMQTVYVEKQEQFQMKWTEFILKYFYDPTSIGVSETDSNSCSAPDTGGFLGGIFFCYNGSGDIMKTAWEKFSNDNADSYFYVIPATSYADVAIDSGKNNPFVPDGRLDDNPKPMMFPSFWTLCYQGTCYSQQYLMFPMKAIVEKMDILVPMIAQCVNKVIFPYFNACSGNMYIMGGNIPLADDGVNSLPLHRRHGGFLMSVRSLDVRTSFERVFYNTNSSSSSSVDENDNVPNGGGDVVQATKFSGKDDFPGNLCHNHASADYPTPQKDDWTKPCDPTWSPTEKLEKCFSFQETAWGTRILEKLEGIHADVDPHHLFQCWDCVGYREKDDILNDQDVVVVEPTDTDTETPSVSPTPSSGDMPSASPHNAVLGVMMASWTFLLFFGGAW